MMQSRPGYLRGAIGAGLALTLAWIVLLPAAAAHGYQAESQPAANSRLTVAPTSVHIVMSEPVEVQHTDAWVFDTDGNDHAAGAVRSPSGNAQSSEIEFDVDPLENGTYTVAWEALWVEDGHVTQGGFAFVIGNGSLASAFQAPASNPLPGAGESVGRALAYAGWLMVAGVAAYPWVAGRRGLPAGVTKAHGLIGSRSIRWVLVGAAAALLGSMTLLAVQGQNVGGVQALVTSTQIGPVLLARVLAAALALVAAVFALRAGRGHAVLVAIGLIGLATVSWTSHARASGNPIRLLADFIHLVAAALWTGILVGFSTTYAAAAKHLSGPERATYAASCVGRVSQWALAGVIILVLTGALAAIAEVQTLGRLTGTTYGQLLSLKLGMVVVLVALGAVNQRVFLPRLRAAARSASTAGDGSVRRLRRTVAAELIVITLVLATTGVLAGTSPNPDPGGPLPAQVTLEMPGRDANAIVTIEPARIGINSIEVLLTRADSGEVIDDARQLTVLLNDDEGKLPTGQSVLEEQEPGRFTGNVTFGVGGNWLVTLKLQRETAYDDFMEGTLRIPT